MKMFLEYLEEWLENSCDESYVIYAWNEYTDDNRYFEDRIYYMYELDDLFCDCKASDLRGKLDSDFSHNEKYFHDSIYGLTSFDDISDIVEYDSLAEFIMEHESRFDTELGLENVLDDWKEEAKDDLEVVEENGIYRVSVKDSDELFCDIDYANNEEEAKDFFFDEMGDKLRG